MPGWPVRVYISGAGPGLPSDRSLRPVEGRSGESSGARPSGAAPSMHRAGRGQGPTATVHGVRSCADCSDEPPASVQCSDVHRTGSRTVGLTQQEWPLERAPAGYREASGSSVRVPATRVLPGKTNRGSGGEAEVLHDRGITIKVTAARDIVDLDGERSAEERVVLCQKVQAHRQSLAEPVLQSGG